MTITAGPSCPVHNPPQTGTTPICTCGHNQTQSDIHHNPLQSTTPDIADIPNAPMVPVVRFADTSDTVKIDEPPMGVSEWINHGKKYGYDKYLLDVCPKHKKMDCMECWYTTSMIDTKTCINGHKITGIVVDECPECEAKWIEEAEEAYKKGDVKTLDEVIKPYKVKDLVRWFECFFVADDIEECIPRRNWKLMKEEVIDFINFFVFRQRRDEQDQDKVEETN
jgi:hypothetical protein